MKRKQSLGAVLAALVVAMVACGIDAAGEASRAPSAQTPVKIGVAPSLNVSVSGMVDLGLADVRDINDAGEIVGTIDVAGHQHAALLVSGKVYDLGTTDNSGTTPASSSASGINRVGQVVGHGAVGTEEYNFVWTPDAPNGTTGTMRRLLPAPDGSVGHAVRINDAGQVIGNSEASALLWTGGQVVQLGTLMEGGRSGAEAINNFGQVVGTAVRDTPSGDEWRAFLWTPDVPNGATGTMVDLIGPTSNASGINDRGQVVGAIISEAYLWTPSSPNTNAGTTVMLGDRMENGLDINDHGQVAGTVFYSPEGAGLGVSHAALWTPDEPNGATGAVTDLGPAGQPPNRLSPWGEARALSDQRNGQTRVVGGVYGNGAVFESGPSFLWTVVTQPTPPNQGPVARPALATGSEGSAVAFDGTASTGSRQPLTFSWNFGDGTSGTGPIPSHAYADNGAYTAALVVTDATGLVSAPGTTTATIYNVAPVATLSATPSQVTESESITVALHGAEDVAADLASLQFAFDCGDGLGYGSFAGASSVICGTIDAGSRTVRGKVKDKDGGANEYAASVPVLNAAPAVTIVSAPKSVRVRESFTIRFRFTDPGTQDAPWQYRIDWGDGRTPTGPVAVSAQGGPVAVSAQGGTVTETYRYQGSGGTKKTTLTVIVTVTDKNGGVGTASTRIIVTR